MRKPLENYQFCIIRITPGAFIGKLILEVLPIFVLFILSTALLYSQDNRMVFSHVDVNDGLSENWIKCIYKDSRGFMWFGTNSGLNRFDGYEFEIFRKDDPGSTAIADNDIKVITEDKDGNLWIGTGNGISILDYNTYKFRKVDLVPSSPLFCQDIGYITAMSTDAEGNILIGTHNGLFLFNQQNKTLRHVLIDEVSCSSQTNNITAISNDRTGCFWIGTNNGFVIKYNKNSNSFEKFESLRDVNSRSVSITKIYVDNEDICWIVDQNGLHLFNTKEKSWDYSFQEKYGKVFNRLQITGIGQDTDNQIWVITDGNGAFIIDRKEFHPRNILNLPYAEGSLSSNGLYSLYCDKSGIVWIGTSKRGVDFYKKNVREFRLYTNYPTDSNSLSNNDVDCITEDFKGNIWIGTNGGGLNYYDRKSNLFKHYISWSEKPNSLSSNIIVSVFEDSEEKLWIGTYFGGLNCLDPETGEIKVYRHNDSDSTSLSDDRVWGICEDSRKNLWVATLTNGLNLLDRRSGKFKRINSQNSPLCFDYLNYITTDENDNLWISSAHGLIYYDPFKNSSKCFYNNPETTTSLSDNHIVSTFKDSRGLFWVCTNNGLNLMDQVSETFRVFKVADGLPSNNVLRILEDRNTDLWISTKNGISKLIITKSGGKDSLSFRFVNYGMSDGLQGKEFNETASLKTRNGELWFGGPDGLNSFYPLEITEDTSTSQLVITNLRIDNKIVRISDTINNRILLEKPIFNTDKLVLKYKENSFIIDFVALNYFFPERNKYEYNLEGFNDKWIVSEGNENFATFSNIVNGSYTFKVRGTNSDGIWNNIPVTLQIKVLPPFYKSWYAYAIYVLLIISFLAILRYLTLTRERMNARLVQESIESQHIHEIDSMKIKFFTNISHEFRTPLTLILSTVEKLMIQWENTPEERYLKLILRNGRRLLFMVNQLLDFRKMEVQGFGFNPSVGNIIAVIEEAVYSFMDLSEYKHIKLGFYSELRELNTFFDTDKLEKIILNLLSNAFKFTPVDGNVTVTLLPGIAGKPIEKGADIANLTHLILKVEDTGIGIPADKIGNLFVKFYQVHLSDSGDHGSGIGLSLVKEFVKLHGGEISVESEPGKGSCFTVVLPIVDTGQVLSENSIPGIENSKTDNYNISPLLYETDSDIFPKEKPTLLIAEDNDDFRFYIKDNLQSQYNVYEASNGDEAYAIIQEIIPDLIISDIMMPGIDGKELCRKIKADPYLCHIPFILLAARSTEEEQFESLETGADDCILKPFSFQMLEVKISNLINIRRNLRQVFKKSLSVEPKEITITSLDEQFIQKALDLVEKNISNTEYTVEELSRDLNMSRTLLYKKILTLSGKPPLEFMRTLRLKRAAQLLQKSQLHVAEIAFRVGFNDPKYFRKHFKNEFGIIPSRYAKQFKIK